MRLLEFKREWEFHVKKLLWITGFFAALSIKAGDLLQKKDDEGVVHLSRVGEQESPAVEPELAAKKLVSPAQQPGNPEVEQLDPNFKGDRSPGLGPSELRFERTGIDSYKILEVDPHGPKKHLFDKIGKTVSGEELGLGASHH